MAIDAILLKAADNVATAVQDLQAGQTAAIRLDRDISTVVIQESIPYGHKFACRSIKLGDNIIKYGEVIGRATIAIPTGCHAHVQNIESLRGRGDLRKED
ncbi:UxaA family hydrolase [Sporomusa sp.]|uniref:UxaA family hydrolase n=1 Tax=Sporomusa sp. TaxID=2078658 RepID=UPI002C77E1BB|nr:UxaA family hydrolase [Sporomusa sp.]HWR05963.1 UxaA family hydrolase [Sporomusa sp.]